MLKVMTIVGTRPELIKMSRVIAEFDRHTQHVLVHTGQNYDYELNQVFFDDLEIRKPDHFLEAVGDNAAKTIARVIEKADEVLATEQPDAVMLYGDTNSAWQSLRQNGGRCRYFTWRRVTAALTSACPKSSIARCWTT